MWHRSSSSSSSIASLLPPPLEIDFLILSLAPNSPDNFIGSPGYSANLLHFFNPSTFVLRGRVRTSEGGEEEEATSTSIPDLAYNVEGELLVTQVLPSWNRLSSFVLSNASCDLVWFRLPLLMARAAREGGSPPSSFAVYLDGLDAPWWDLTKEQPKLEWAQVVHHAQVDMDMGAVQAIEVVVWVETEEKRREVKKLTTEAREEAFSWGTQTARFDVRVEVWPSQAGRRDREDGWAGKTIESWR